MCSGEPRAMRPIIGAFIILWGSLVLPIEARQRPNVLLLIADQWRSQALGYAGDPNVQTPQLDALQRTSVFCVNAVAGMPVCCPSRASFFTGQPPLAHGVFLNDVPLDPQAVTLPKVLGKIGYQTGYIGKWHLNGGGRSAFIPKARRQGFEYWKVLECTHDYNQSFYYSEGPEKQVWPGYDAFAQTRDAQRFMRERARRGEPFFLVVAWGPPHDPYQTAPIEFRRKYEASKLKLRGNVPEALQERVRSSLAGYYAHCTALDACVGDLLKTLRETGLEDNTLVVFTSDHGDLLGSQGGFNKQQPYEESVRVPLMFHWPRGLKSAPRQRDALINSEDLMPTLLGLCRVAIPKTVSGIDFSKYLKGGKDPSDGVALLSCVAPFGNWDRRQGGKEFRGLRTRRYTYVRDLNGPWLLFDNQTDPEQRENLVNQPNAAVIQAELETILQRKLKAAGDEFLPGAAYIQRWGYRVDANGTVPVEP